MPTPRVPGSAPRASRAIVLLFTLAAVILAVFPRAALYAQATINPADYALDATRFPAGSQVVTSEEAPNWRVEGEHLQVGPRMADGRLTGYYMQVLLPASAGSARSTISYLVSVFLTADNVATAVSQQAAFWGTLLQPNPLNVDIYQPVGQGDAGTEYWYAYHDVNGRTHEEHFFQRGRVFIQVNLDIGSGKPADADVQAFLAVAKLLDSVATHGPLGTPTPTATSTATSTPTATTTSTPTATATATPKPKPRPTATRAPTHTPTPVLKVIKEGTGSSRCKKGHHRVHGKCQKIKKG